MSERKFIITDAVEIKKESRQVKPLSRLQISLFIQVHSSIRAPPNNNQSFNISSEWLIRSSKSTFAKPCIQVWPGSDTRRGGGVNSGKMSNTAFLQWRSAWPRPATSRPLSKAKESMTNSSSHLTTVRVLNSTGQGFEILPILAFFCD